jgi:hypothetical protein
MAETMVELPLLEPVTITFEPREDGGIRVYSKDLPGLILSGLDVKAVMADVLTAAKMLQEYKLGVRVTSDASDKG